MSNVGYATLQIIPSAKGFAAALNGQTSSAMAASGRKGGAAASKGFAGAFLPGIRGLAGGFAAMYAGSKAIGFLKDSVAEASDLNEAGTALQQVFGKATDQIMAFAGGGAKALGMSRLEAMQAAQTFGVYGKAAGLAGKANADFSKGMVSLSTDLASFYNSSPEEAMQAIAAGLRGENEPLRRFGVLLDDATLRQEALKQGLIKTTSQALTPQQKVLAAHAVILRQTKVAQGDFARTSGGLANQQRILSARMADLKGKIGRGLLPVVLAVTKGFSSFVGSIGSVAGRLKPVVGVLDLFWGTLTGKGAKSAAAGALPSGLMNGVIDFATKVQGVVAKVIGVLDLFWGTLTGKGAQTGFVDSLNGPMINAVINFAASVRNVVDTIRANFVPILRQVFQIITTNVVPVFRAVVSILVTKVWPAVLSIYQAVASALVPILKALFSTIQANVLPALARVWERFQTWLPTIQRVVGVIVTVVAWLVRLAVSILKVVLPPLIKFTGWLLGAVVRALATVIGWVVRIVGWVLNFGHAIGTAGAAVGRFAVVVAQKVGEVFGFFRELPAKVQGFFADAGKWLLEAGKAIIGGLLKGITQKFEDVKHFVGGVGGWIKDHKGPLPYDRRLLIPAGQAIMGGLNRGLQAGFGSVQSTIGDVNGLLGSVAAPYASPDLSTPGGGSSAAGGPLIGSLTLQSRESVHDDLEETMFTLRRIKRGGVHV